MNQYRGEVRRQQPEQLNRMPLENDRNNFEAYRQESYSRSNDYERSELSYYQSEVSHTVYNNEMGQSQKNIDLNRSNSDAQDVYDKIIPVRVQSTEAEQFNTYLRIQIVNTVERGTNKLTLYLTDDKNPTFLWIFFVKENDFMILKKQQKLRVDFRGFPSMLMHHFDICKSQGEAVNSVSVGELYFFCLFEMKKNSEGLLNIVEANRYKESIHLSLKCKQGNDDQTKQYLSTKLLKVENENANLNKKISCLEQLLSTRKQEIAKIEIQLKHQRTTNEKSSEEFQIQLNKLQNELKRDKIQGEERLKRSHQKQFKEMKLALEEQLAKYVKSYDDIKQKYESCQQKLTSLESKERQSSFDVSTKGKEIETYAKRLEQMKFYTTQLQNQRVENQKTMIEQRVRIESLQSQINDKLKIIESNSELKSTNSHQISLLQLKNGEYKRQIEKQETKMQSLQSEILKLESTVEDYREKYEKKKEKNQEKNTIIKQQERYINQKQNQVFDVKRQLQNKQKLFEEAKLDVEDKNRKISDLKNQIDACQKKIKEDNDLITHLQKQINERTIGMKSGFGVSSYQRTTSPFSSTHSANREFLAAGTSAGNSTLSRLKFTSTGGDNGNEEIKQKMARKEVQIKRYTPTNQQRERSKSPVLNSRLNQQREPEEGKQQVGSIKPVKFKFSQRQ